MQTLTILLTFFKIVVRPLITKENLYLEILIRHSLLCSVLTLVCVFCCPVFIGSWGKKKKNVSLHFKMTTENSISHWKSWDIRKILWTTITYICISSSNFQYIKEFIANLKFFRNFNFCSFLSRSHKSLSTKLNLYPALCKTEWWLRNRATSL